MDANTLDLAKSILTVLGTLATGYLAIKMAQVNTTAKAAVAKVEEVKKDLKTNGINIEERATLIARIEELQRNVLDLSKDKATSEARDRTALDKDRETLNRDRAALDKGKPQ